MRAKFDLDFVLVVEPSEEKIEDAIVHVDSLSDDVDHLRDPERLHIVVLRKTKKVGSLLQVFTGFTDEVIPSH